MVGSGIIIALHISLFSTMDGIINQFTNWYQVLFCSSGGSGEGIFGDADLPDADEEILSCTQQGNTWLLFWLFEKKPKKYIKQLYLCKMQNTKFLRKRSHHPDDNFFYGLLFSIDSLLFTE